MSIIKIEDLYFSYTDSLSPVFDGLTLCLDSRWKLGLVGENGRGKSTLLKILCGELPCRGVTADLVFRRFPLSLSGRSVTVGEFAESFLDGESWKFRREANLLGLAAECLYSPMEELSGGELTKAMLAVLFAGDGYALIDEPTDHLDGEGRARVADYLSGKDGFLVVSHDRAFLDGCCDHILALEKGGAVLVRGNYSVYAEERDKRKREEQCRKEKLEKERARLGRSADRAGRWADSAERSIGKNNEKMQSKYAVLDRGYLGAKAAKGQKRAGAVAARQSKAEEDLRAVIKSLEEERRLRLFPEKFFRPELLRLENIGLFTEKKIFENLSFTVNAGERIALTGGNGSGKSTLLRFLCGYPSDYARFSGEFVRSQLLKISYLPQTTNFAGSIADYARSYGIDVGYFNAVLKNFGFETKDLMREMSALSEGQKKKAALCRSLCERAHLYLWDEPLNSLDVTARERLEDAVLASGATVVFTEHDRAFTDKIATKIVRLS